ncbi:hypothetical protein [Microbacterium alcoholitolerans]|uniref:hypothetical protein n=1 Tax=unclassified Microbacterium TaxID=2609290 RepID=UPI003D16AE31
MRLASADRRSIAKWLWSSLGVLAWVILATAFGGSPASANDGSDAEAPSSSASSAANPHAGHEQSAPGQSVAARAANGPDAKGASASKQAQAAPTPAVKSPAAPARQSQKSPVGTQAAATTNAKPETKPSAGPARGAEQAPNGAPRPAQDDHDEVDSDESRKPSDSKNTLSSGSDRERSPDRDDRDDRDVRSDRDDRSARDDDDRSSRDDDQRDRSDRSDDSRWSKSPDSSRPGHSYGHGKHGASAPGFTQDHGKAPAHADHDAPHGDRHDDRRAAAHALRDNGSITHADRIHHAPQRALAPAPVASTPATASVADDSTPAPYPPLSNDAPTPQPTTTPATSGAGATGISPLQLTGDDIAGSAQLDSILLGIAEHSDDDLPSDPTTTTDSSPD